MGLGPISRVEARPGLRLVACALERATKCSCKIDLTFLLSHFNRFINVNHYSSFQIVRIKQEEFAIIQSCIII
jgi:hypothetical protein